MGCNPPEKAALHNPQLLPAPVSQEQLDGAFELNQQTVLDNQAYFNITATFLTDFLKLSNIDLKNGTASTNYITILKDNSIVNAEGYVLEITPKSIKIKASTDAGAFYAVQSLRQLMAPQLENTSNYTSIPIPALNIKDEPRFSYRGMHLDVSRHMFDVAFIKKYIDAMALLKMNNFHWHLTDDQGWRIEIKKYPELQETAAYRDSTLIGHYNDQPVRYDGKIYGGFYTQEDIKEVIAFAKARHINIIPEIEMPGHAQAAIAAYPALGCTNNPVDVATTWGVFDDIFCPNEETFTFLENVIDEVIALFPGKYIHIGGDETPKTQWKTSTAAQQVMKENNLKTEEELQSYFIQRMERYINSKGKQIIGWDEILEGGLAPNATVMSWRGNTGAIEAARAGHDVIMTPTSHSYFDYYQSEDENEPTAIGGFLPLEKVYSFNPIPPELSETEATFILGPQANLWTEYITTQQQVEYMVFPRMIAMSEVAWSMEGSLDYPNFISRLENFQERLDVLDIHYANHLYEIKGSFNADHTYKLFTVTQGKDIRYTIDNSEPTPGSSLYSEPILFDKSITIKAAVFKGQQKLGSIFIQKLEHHKAVGAAISINKTPHPSYSGNGAQGLINGIKGSDTRYGDSEWLGFWGDDVEIEITFPESQKIATLELRFFEANGQWLYTPKKVDIEIINDESGKPVISTVPIVVDDSKTVQEITIKLADHVQNTIVNSIILNIPNYGTIPEGLQGAGNKAWTFIDEITIK